MQNFDALIDALNSFIGEMYDCRACFYKEVDNEVGARYRTDVISGDWKHDHLYIDALVKEFMGSFEDAMVLNIGHEYVDDTGSDWGHAYHYFSIIKGEHYKDQRVVDRARADLVSSLAWYDYREGRISFDDAMARSE